MKLKDCKKAKAMKLKLQQKTWRVDDCIPLHYQLNPQLLNQIDPNLQHHFCLLLSRDVYSEGDSLPLWNYLLTRKAEFSDDFWQMMIQWFEDEQKHYEALRRVYRLISGISFREMDLVFAERNHEIEPIKALLTDEFTILVSLLFDDRLWEIPDLLKQLVQLEKQLGRYCKTFFLDHAQEQLRFPTNFNAVISQIILAQFGLAKYPEQIQNLWQWKLARWDFVP